MHGIEIFIYNLARYEKSVLHQRLIENSRQYTIDTLEHSTTTKN